MADKRLDDYKPVDFYTSNRPKGADRTGFYKFAADGFEYFAYQVDGTPVLISQAYKARAGRDNGIVSTRKNMKVAEQVILREDGKGGHYFDVVARNKQNVATSVLFGSEADARAAADVLLGKRKALAKPGSTPKSKAAAGAAAAGATAAAKRSGNIEDNYKRLDFYRRHGTGVRDGFDRIEHEGVHYFTYNRDGDILLISEGYPSASDRDRGIRSVEDNINIENRYKATSRGSRHGFSLRAGNNREIARSVTYTGAAAAAAGAALLHGAGKRKGNVEQNYKPLAFFEENISGVEEGFDTFEAGGQHYFTYNRDGKPFLISEGYPTAAARDKGIAAVQRNMGDASMYSYGPVGGGFEGYRLRAKNNKEIARSVGYPTAAAAAAGAAFLFAPDAEAAPVVDPQPIAPPEPEPVVVEDPVPVAPIAAAAAVPVAAAAAMRDPEPAAPAYADDGIVAVHEEGAGLGWLKWLLALLALAALAFLLLRLCSDRDATIATPVADRDAVSDEVVADDDMDDIGIVGDLDELDVAGENVADDTAMGATLSDDGTTDLADATTFEGSGDLADPAPTVPDPAPAKPQPITCWDGSLEATVEQCPPVPEPDPEPAPVSVTTATPTSGRSDVRGDLVYGDVPGTCACATGSSEIFRTQGSELPVIVTRLGTNPEFGNHQGQGADGFFRTLQNRYASDTYDRQYLDYLARSIGYSGFGDMDVGMFSETTVPNGSRVMLGYGSQHALQYSELALVSSADNSAFRVRSANGCDVAFMKTCGNFAYVCE